MAEHGFSTGILYQTEIPIVQRICNFALSGATAIELNYASPDDLLTANPESLFVNMVKPHAFYYISIHAPWQEVKYGNNEQTRKIIEKFAEFCDILPINGIVMHPDIVQSFSVLENTNLPFLLENMDKRKDFYTMPEHFYDILKNYGFGFVLDVQHAYEQDHSMNIGNAFLDAFGDRLKELHVSGSSLSSSNPHHEFHCPISLAENKVAIGKILRQNPKIPKILEGIISADIPAVLNADLAYLSNFQ